MITLIATTLTAGLLAYANGANDNPKGVATLVGGGVTTQRRALWLAAAATMLGSLTAILLAHGLIARFGGKGIVDDPIASAPAFPACVGLAAAVTVLLATVLGMPISTTHALVGAIVGIGLAAGSLNTAAVGGAFLAPLLISPVVAIGLAGGVYAAVRAVRIATGVTRQSCVCIGQDVEPVALTADGAAVVVATGVRLTVGEAESCRERYVGRVLGLDVQRVVDGCHLLSAGALSFARGLNDTPKIAAIMLAAQAAGSAMAQPWLALVLTGFAIAAGGLTAVRRVAHTMSKRITGMNDGQALTANATAAVLVILASKYSLPVSTTHVTCGSLFGIGAANRRLRWGMVLRILAAWVTTLPLAAALGWIAWRIAVAI